MTDIPAISVIVPLYNKGPYIARALNSILSQTFQDFELIVVDDGSNDNGADIVKKYNDPRIHLIQQNNLGVSAARNNGVKEARAKLIAFLDADDEWLPIFLETVIRLSDKFPSAGAYATAIITSHKGTISNAQYRSLPSPKWEGLVLDYFRSLLLGDLLIRSSSVAIPRDILLEMNGFITDAKWGEDQDLWGRIALKYPIAFSTSCCSIIHVTSASVDQITFRVTVTKEHPFIKTVYNESNNKYKGDINENYLKLYLDYLIVKSAIVNVIVGQDDDSKTILSKCASRAFILTRIILHMWYILPKKYILNHTKIRKRFLLTTLSYMHAFELHTLGFVISHRKKF